VTLAANDHPLLLEAVHVHEVVLASKDDVLGIRGPADAEQPAEVGPGIDFMKLDSGWQIFRHFF
jgi:hypothetical protein